MTEKPSRAATVKEDRDPGPNPAAPPRRGRPLGDREAKRIELLRAGIATIADLGYSGASLRKVAGRAGHTTGAVTYYFQNKEAMVSAILEYLFDMWDTLVEAGDETTDLKPRFRRWLDMNVDSEQWMAQFQLLAQARHEPALAEIYQRRYGEYRRKLAVRIAKQQKSGEVRDDIPADILADQISALGDGWSMMLPIEPERFTPERLETLLDAIAKLIAPPTKAA